MESLNLVRMTGSDVLPEEARAIYEEAFPGEEKRPWEMYPGFLSEKPSFRFYVARDGERIVGVLIFWELEDFVYGDYLAVTPHIRNRGYGRRIVRSLQELTGKPILLEVEVPEEEMARRRIGFYERLGFHLLDHPYAMPDFTAPGAWFPMRLMSYPEPWDEKRCAEAVKKLYEEIYGVSGV